MRSIEDWWNFCKVIRSIFLFSLVFSPCINLHLCRLQSLCEYSQRVKFVGKHRRTRNIFHLSLERANAKWIYLHIQFGTTLISNTIIFHAKWNAHSDVTLNGSIRKWINGQLNWVVHFTAVLPLIFFTTLWTVITIKNVHQRREKNENKCISRAYNDHKNIIRRNFMPLPSTLSVALHTVTAQKEYYSWVLFSKIKRQASGKQINTTFTRIRTGHAHTHNIIHAVTSSNVKQTTKRLSKNGARMERESEKEKNQCGKNIRMDNYMSSAVF